MSDDGTSQELAIRRAFVDWWDTANEEIDDIRCWRDYDRGKGGRHWPPMPKRFDTDTVAVAGWLTARYPHLDPAPLFRIYDAVVIWHRDWNDANLPPQHELDELLETAVRQLRTVFSSFDLPRLYPKEETLPDPTTTKGDRPASTPTNIDGPLDRLANLLTPQGYRIVDFLWNRLNGAGFNAIATVPKAFQGGPTDEAIVKALKRIGTCFNQHLDLGLSISICSAKRRAKLTRLPDSAGDK
jgi:hypothetical protein